MAFVNQATWDRILRIVIGLAMLAFGFLVAEGLLATALKLFGWVPLLEGAVGWSPFYALLDIDTSRQQTGSRRKHPSP